MKLSNEEYFSNEALSFSTMKELLNSPKHFWRAKEEGIKKTPSMELGTAIHCGILEPQEFIRNYILEPQLDKRSKAYKEWLSGEGYGKLLYSQETKEIIENALESTYSEAMSLIEDGMTINEEAFFFEDTFLKMKCKVDAYCKGEKILIDLKTSSDISPREFQSQIFKRAYHMQMAHYKLALENNNCPVDRVIIVAISTNKPFDLVEYEISSDVLAQATEELRKLYSETARVLSFGDRCGYSDIPISVSEYPKWYNVK